MIRKVRFNNFYSFGQEQEINFLAKKKKTFDYFDSKTNDQITKVAGFLGGNASGKTNVMRLFSFIAYFSCVSSRNDSKSGVIEENSFIPFKTFFNNNRLSTFYIEFEKDDSIFFYEFSIRKNIVIKEKLSIRNVSKKTRKMEIFSREKSEIKLTGKFFGDFPSDKLNIIRPDVSLISFIHSNYNIEIINKIFFYFISFRFNVSEKDGSNTNHYRSQIASIYMENENLKTKMEELIRDFSIGLKGFEIKQETSENGTPVMSIKGIHITKEKNNKLNFNYESTGTKSLFLTLGNIIDALENDGVVIIDEIELGLHPEAVIRLISYFINKNEKGKAQLIFSSHSLEFMNKFDMHQIYLVAKDDESISYVYRLNDVQGIRTDENFLNKYMSGNYGAFPSIKI